jgi:hypothetical protein
MPLASGAQPVTVFDLGSSEGHNSIQIMRSIALALRRRTGQPIETIYSDLSSNNFNQLFANLERARSAGQFPAEVYAAAAGGSFYAPLLPPGTVLLATCFNAILWLDRLPAVPVTDFVAYRRPRPPRPGLAVSPATTAAFKGQAERDLIRFLEARARELVPGGKLLIASPGDTDEIRIGDGLFDVLNDACLDLVAAGRMEQKEYGRLTMPAYYRTLEELLAPVQGEGSPVFGLFDVERAETLEVPVPYIADYRRDGDAAAYAAAFTGFLRAFTEPVVQAALTRPEEGAAASEALYERIRTRLLEEPERYLWRYFIVAVLMTRR